MQIDVVSIVRTMIDTPNTPFTARQLAKTLALDNENAVRKAMERLEEAGVLRRVKRGAYIALLGARQAVGQVRMKTRGFGFVQPLGGKPAEDIFVPRRAVGGALDGDFVLVEIDPGRHAFREERCPVGHVKAVVKRAASTLVGTLTKTGSRMQVEPDMLRGARSIRLLDPPPADAKPGDKVTVRLEAHGAASGEPRGRVIEVLGREGDPFMEHRIVARHYGFEASFPPAVSSEAEAMREIVPDNAEDFRSHLVVTIDPEDARDYDDAVGLTVRPDGTALLEVHIADVARYVRPGTACDAEARRRTTSVYFPGMAIPMLPERLSSDLCSLVPDKPRPAKSVLMEIDAEGQLRSTRVANGVIISKHRLTYQQAQAMLASPSSGPTRSGKRPCPSSRGWNRSITRSGRAN